MRRTRWHSLTPKSPVRRAENAAGLPGGDPKASARKGSTIVVVIALLLALTFLGIVGYTIGVQEQGNATYFAEAAKQYDFGLTADELFDWGLRQVILGTRLEERQSALHGGHMSLLATLLGRDTAPYSGEGVHLGMNGASIFVDRDHNGSNDGTDYLLELNRAPFAQDPAGSQAVVDQNNYPDPDAGYTYWDNNSPFLAYVNEQHVYNFTAGTINRLIIPSFHRPQYLRSLGVTGGATNWYTDDNTVRRVLRPHQDHKAVANNGSGIVSTINRFVLPGEETALGLLQPSFFTAFPTVEGVWGGALGADKYDADPDGDGIKEAVYLDLDFPMQIRDNPDGTKTNFVPMFAFTIMDADALLNLNAHGNLAGVNGYLSYPVTTDPFGLQQVGPGADNIPGTGDDVLDLRYISQSNQGLAVSEVNPLWAFKAPPLGETLDQHERFFGHQPADERELGNMEWFFLLAGRADLDAMGAIQNLYPGRSGEVTLLDNAIQNGTDIAHFPSAGGTYQENGLGAVPVPATNFNPPVNDPNGFDVWDLGTDDNYTAQTGGDYNDTTAATGRVFNPSITLPAWRHPLDLHASGIDIDRSGGTGAERYLRGSGRYKWPAYAYYKGNPDIDLFDQFNQANPPFMPGFIRRLHVDEPEEAILEPALARSDLDAIFGPDENATLHLTQTDQDTLGLSGRLQSLAPINFNGLDGVATKARRARFTTTSWDLKAFSKPVYDASLASVPKFRTWEVTDADGDGPGDGDDDGTGDVFPPQFPNVVAPAVDPFRPAVRELLTVNSGSVLNGFEGVQRKLSLNHICDYKQNTERVRFRPLTPHPEGLTAAAIGSASAVSSPEDLIGNHTPQRQEYLARRDRQQLCRDIYVLLYTFCGPDTDSSAPLVPVNYTTATDPYGALSIDSTKDGTADTNARLQQMAQFAVNLVDRMDTDSVITVFEYDNNLADGWDMDDNPFSSTGENDRAVVFGVEEQLLALNEAQVIFAKRVLDKQNLDQPKNHEATEYNDELNRDWTFVELANVSPTNVPFNENWQIIMESDPNAPPVTGLTFDVNPRRLTLTGGAANSPSAGGNGLFTIGTTGDRDNHGAYGSVQRPPSDPQMPSHFRVNKDYDPDMDNVGTANEDQRPFHAATNLFDSDNRYEVAPRSGALDLDLIKATQQATPRAGGSYRVQDVSGVNDQVDDPLAMVLGGEEFFSYTGDGNAPLDVHDTLAPGTPIMVQFRLRRRLHLDRDPPTTVAESQDNPWVDVDTLSSVGMDIFALRQDTMGDPGAAMPPSRFADDYNEIPQKLAEIRSRQRRQPLRKSTEADYTTVDPNDYQRNRLGLVNLNAPAQFEDYQPHFDRDFSSVGELLGVPIYGPGNLTTGLQNSDALAGGGTAADLFLLPDVGLTNRWYRLFEFVEVLDQSHRHYQDDPEAFPPGGTAQRPPFVVDVENQSFRRSPGQLQLNTMRHAEVLGALLDDSDLIQNNAFLTEFGAGGRSWWADFLEARDGQDPTPGATLNMILPGLPVAKPFRDFSFTGGVNGNASLEHTVLRENPNDTATPKKRLFEMTGTDHSVRYRLLEKVLNNSTNRSNVFLIFMQVDYFEAVEVTDDRGTPMDASDDFNVVRVGGKLPDSPGYRGFFVVDRSIALDLIDPELDLPQSEPDPVDGQTKFSFSFNQEFDFHQLILHRQTIN